MNASYNLDLVEQRLILLAIVEAKRVRKGINANDPLTVHAESYINQFGVARQTAYQALKDACDDLLHVNSVTKKSMNEEIPKTSVHVGLVKFAMWMQKLQ